MGHSASSLRRSRQGSARYGGKIDGMGYLSLRAGRDWIAGGTCSVHPANSLGNTGLNWKGVKPMSAMTCLALALLLLSVPAWGQTRYRNFMCNADWTVCNSVETRQRIVFHRAEDDVAQGVIWVTSKPIHYRAVQFHAAYVAIQTIDVC